MVAAQSRGPPRTSERLNDKYEDDVSGLAYYGARYYDKTLIGWTQGDTSAEPIRARCRVGSTTERQPLYRKPAANSLRYIDPDGQEAEQVGQATTFVYNVASYALEVAEANASSASPLQKAAAVVAIGTFVAATVLGFASEATTSATTALMKPIDLGFVDARDIDLNQASRGTRQLPDTERLHDRESGVFPLRQAASGGAASGGGGGWEGNGSKPTLDAHKAALKKVPNQVGGSLPLGKPGKFGKPSAGHVQEGVSIGSGTPIFTGGGFGIRPPHQLVGLHRRKARKRGALGRHSNRVGQWTITSSRTSGGRTPIGSFPSSPHSPPRSASGFGRASRQSSDSPRTARSSSSNGSML